MAEHLRDISERDDDAKSHLTKLRPKSAVQSEVSSSEEYIPPVKIDTFRKQKRNRHIPPKINNVLMSANELIKLCGFTFKKISCVQDINSSFFIGILKTITSVNVPDILEGNDDITEAHNIQSFIDTLSLDIIIKPLFHITGEDIVACDESSILCLLKILKKVFLKIHKKKNLKKASEDDSISSLQYLVLPLKEDSSSEEDILPIRLLKRKTLRNTFQELTTNPHIPPKKNDVPEIKPGENSKPQRSADFVDAVKLPVKRKMLKSSTRTVNHLHTTIEGMLDLNFELKIRALLHSDKSPTLRAQQMKKKYVQSLTTPLKTKPMAPCNKSFLLPHNLRHRRVSPVRQSPTRRTQRDENIKKIISESSEKQRKDREIPGLMKSVLEEFPGFQFPKNTQDFLTRQYGQHVRQMYKQLKNAVLKKPTTLVQTEKAMEDEAKLSKILLKDLKEKKYLRELNEQKEAINNIEYEFRDARLKSAKTRQYFDEYKKQLNKKMEKRNYTEEVLIEKTFKELLNIQKKTVTELCDKVRETDKQDARQHRQYLSALKNLYREQLSVVFDELINAEKKESSERAKAEKWAAEKMDQNVRKNLLKGVQCLDKDIVDMIQDIYVRELDAQNFIASFQLLNVN